MVKSDVVAQENKRKFAFGKCMVLVISHHFTNTTQSTVTMLIKKNIETVSISSIFTKWPIKNEFTLFILHRWLRMSGDSRKFGSSTNRLVDSYVFICLLLYLRLCFIELQQLNEFCELRRMCSFGCLSRSLWIERAGNCKQCTS